jgi:hypothetical protein
MACPSARQGYLVYLDTYIYYKGKLLIQEFSELTMEDVEANAQHYQDKGSGEAQNAEMLI